MTDSTDLPSLDELEARLLVDPGMDAAALEAESIAVLGRKSGVLTAILRGLPAPALEERRRVGPPVNDLKQRFEAAIEARRAALAARAPETRDDLTMPARRRWSGGLHPVTQVIPEVTGIFHGLALVLGRDVPAAPRLSFPLTPGTLHAQSIALKTEMGETMLMGLRLTGEGVTKASFRARFGHEIEDAFGVEIEGLRSQGLLIWGGGDRDRLQLTSRGRLLGNQVFTQFI